MVKCGRPQCPCGVNPKKRHGPYHEWTYKEKGGPPGNSWVTLGRLCRELPCEPDERILNLSARHDHRRSFIVLFGAPLTSSEGREYAATTSQADRHDGIRGTLVTARNNWLRKEEGCRRDQQSLQTRSGKGLATVRRCSRAQVTHKFLGRGEKGKTVNVRLTAEAAPIFQNAAKQYRALKSALARLEKLSRQAITRLAKEVDSKPPS